MTKLQPLFLAAMVATALPVLGTAHAAPRCSQDAEGSGACVWGRAEGYDGQSLQVRGLTIQLLGVTAPSRKDLCGTRGGPSFDCAAPARKRMGELLAKGGAVCEILDVAAGTLLGRCRVNDGDLGELLVQAGVAAAKDGPYADASHQAMATKRGLWAADTILPKEWDAMRAKTEKAEARRDKDAGEPR